MLMRKIPLGITANSYYKENFHILNSGGKMIVSQDPTPKTKANKTDRRRRPGRKVEILQAVMALLEKGNNNVTTAALAKEVGLSEAALYRHFSGKAAIFKALTDYIEDHLLKPTDKLMESGDSALEQLKRLFNYHLTFFTDHPGLCRLFLVEEFASKKETSQMIRVIGQYTNLIQQLLKQGQKEGTIDANQDVVVAANLYVGMIQAATLRFVMSGFKNTPANDFEGSWSLFIRAVES
ncbi:MAG: nucleoid occlusion factor SlmA [Magnetococcales bacterium]|nr:nucleoid occlusion factor SlmA [Magnetococcales bacterium]